MSHPSLKELDRLRKVHIEESPLNVYTHLAGQFKRLLNRIHWDLFEKSNSLYLPYSRTEQKGNMHSGNPYVAGNPSNVVKERLMFQGTV